MKHFSLSIVAASTILAGCATNDYQVYADTQKSIAQSRAIAEAARYNALAEIAKAGDTAAKVAAVMSLNMGSSSTGSQPQNVAPPKTPGDIALQWTSILLPQLTQIYSINRNADVSIQQSLNAANTAIRQSDNQASIATSTNGTFLGIAGKIQAPQANVTTTTNNTTTNNTTTTTSSVGRDNNTGANSGNAGRMAGGSQTDNTSTPTVVRPEVVQTTNTTSTTTTNTTNSNNTGTTGP